MELEVSQDNQYCSDPLKRTKLCKSKITGPQ